MRTPRPALVLLLCVLVPALLSAQEFTSAPAPAPAVSDPQAVALLQKSLIAMTGGLAFSDVTLTGSARRIAGSDDETGTATLKATSLGDSRVDLILPSGNRSEIRNHSALPLPGSIPTGAPGAASSTPQPAGAWSGPDGVLHGMANHNIATDAAWFFPVGTLTRIASTQNFVLSYVGQETLNGQPVIHVAASQTPPQAASSVTNPPGLPGVSLAALLQHLSQMEVYLDPSTLLPEALAFNVHPDGNALLDIPTRVEFSGYRPINGVQVPLQVEKFVNNGLVLNLQLSGATLNSGLAAANFQIQ